MHMNLLFDVIVVHGSAPSNFSPKAWTTVLQLVRIIMVLIKFNLR